ncbi:uncharacterized protein LOC131251247 isoform X2 [Magnolia sinica]|uniref:uncharacterized protein LOC131251247 isoform X2 n=1 Tax=Magnolia sinica TaxID=86752 RepID=UPI002658EAEA|nr:uncharacterized protein LOC131251247 isoform X2 [Magnolia sinica]XP_058107843.1 uncharacterized protein LOC131251247 isoform X2 [Magnolia sinica]
MWVLERCNGMPLIKSHRVVLIFPMIVCGYHALPLPSRGAEIVFQPLDNLQRIRYTRPRLSALGLCGSYSEVSGCSLETAEVLTAYLNLKQTTLKETMIMGLNPPFKVKAGLANKFIDKALEFKPNLLILIIPKETERLDEKQSPYDLLWEDG